MNINMLLLNWVFQNPLILIWWKFCKVMYLRNNIFLYKTKSCFYIGSICEWHMWWHSSANTFLMCLLCLYLYFDKSFFGSFAIYILKENNTKTYSYTNLLDLQVNMSEITQYLIQNRWLKYLVELILTLQARLLEWIVTFLGI